MNMNYGYPTTIYESILTQMYVFLVLITIFVFYHEKKNKAKFTKTFFLPEICSFGQKYFHICSRITAARVNVNIFVLNPPSMPHFILFTQYLKRNTQLADKLFYPLWPSVTKQSTYIHHKHNIQVK